MDPKWLDWAKRLQALSQNGLSFAQNEFDVDRYEAVGAIAAEIVAQGAGMQIEQIISLFGHEQGYATPKVDVRGVVFHPDNGWVLMVRELSDGRWTLPGGWADPGSSPSENVVREVLEESGYETRAVKLLAVYDRSKHGHLPAYPYHVYKMFFQCQLLGGSARPDHEISEVAFFEESNLPELSHARVTIEQLARLFEHRRHPDWPTDFD